MPMHPIDVPIDVAAVWSALLLAYMPAIYPYTHVRACTTCMSHQPPTHLGQVPDLAGGGDGRVDHGHLLGH